MNIKISIQYNEKLYNFDYTEKSITYITEQFKKALKELELLKQWQGQSQPNKEKQPS